MKNPVAISVEPRCFSDDEVPEGWKLVTILDACEINPPKPPKDFLPADAPVTFVPMPAVDADMGAITNPQIKPYLEVRNGFTSFRDGDVIMAKITPCMENGKAAIVRGMKNGIGFGSTEFHVMRSRGEILPEYLFYYIRQKSFRNEAESHFTGSVGQKRVPTDFIKQSVIPLPPLDEQQRIVARVEALLSHVDAAGDRLSRVPAIMKRFRQSVLAAACSGRLTEEWREENLKEIEFSNNSIENVGPYEIPIQWRWVLLPKLGYMKRGRSKNRPRNAPHLYGGKYPFIQTGDISQSGGRITSHHQTYSEEGLAQSKLWPKNTICITIAANIAESAILTYTACFPDSVVGIIVDDALCSHEYIEYFMRLAKRDLSQFAPGTAQKNINIKILDKVAVPLPPLAEQREIVRRVGLLFERADAIEREVAAAGRRCERLTQAVMVKAFSGML